MNRFSKRFRRSRRPLPQAASRSPNAAPPTLWQVNDNKRITAPGCTEGSREPLSATAGTSRARASARRDDPDVRRGAVRS
ncbi:hypothetical protein PERCYII10_1408 [Pseudomonas aeruginosa]|nr:hypothetical protein PERCYII10_1408 [Pseudomonas aeruginosa]